MRIEALAGISRGRFAGAGLSGGLLFGILDGLINANPLAQELYSVYAPITRTSVNVLAGLAIDLFYGFALAWLFLLLYGSLPGSSGLLKGVSFAAIAWFLRVFMYVASTWMMFTVPAATLLYALMTGLAEMLLLGVFYGTFLRPDVKK